MKKTLLIVLILMIVGTGVLSAQAGKNGSFIKPTWSFGFGFATEITFGESPEEGALLDPDEEYGDEGFSESFMGVGFDVDFVTSIGLTFGLQSLMVWNSGDMGVRPYNAFGIGYTYVTENWCAGAKFMTLPFPGSGGMGFDINGTYWILPNLGVTGISDIYFGLGDDRVVFFALRFGVSAKF